MDTWMLTLNHWENGDLARVSIRMLTPVRASPGRNSPAITPSRATFWAIKNASSRTQTFKRQMARQIGVEAMCEIVVSLPPQMRVRSRE